MMSLVDGILLILDHSTELGLSIPMTDHEWFRSAVGAVLGWSEFALTATLAADVASLLGDPRAEEFSKPIRSMTNIGAVVWFLYFSMRTVWRAPVWPLRCHRGITPEIFLLFLTWNVLWVTCLIQCTGLCILASLRSGSAIRSIQQEKRQEDELLSSRSEDGWKDLMG